MNFFKKAIIGISMLIVISSIGYISYLYFPHLKSFITDSHVREAWKNCRSVEPRSLLDCYESFALKYDNPNICWMLGASMDDWCMQTFYKKSQDPNVCNRIPKLGVKNLCEQYFLEKDAISIKYT